MTPPVTVAILLAPQSHGSRVLIDGMDITRNLRGVEVRAFVGELSTVTLTLSCRAEVTGEVGAVLKQLPEVEGETR